MLAVDGSVFIPRDVGRNVRNKRGGICVYVQGMHSGDGFGERSVRTEADGGRHEGVSFLDYDWKIHEQKQGAG